MIVNQPTDLNFVIVDDATSGSPNLNITPTTFPQEDSVSVSLLSDSLEETKI